MSAMPPAQRRLSNDFVISLMRNIGGSEGIPSTCIHAIAVLFTQQTYSRGCEWSKCNAGAAVRLRAFVANPRRERQLCAWWASHHNPKLYQADDRAPALPHDFRSDNRAACIRAVTVRPVARRA